MDVWHHELQFAAGEDGCGHVPHPLPAVPRHVGQEHREYLVRLAPRVRVAEADGHPVHEVVRVLDQDLLAKLHVGDDQNWLTKSVHAPEPLVGKLAIDVTLRLQSGFLPCPHFPGDLTSEREGG